MNKDLANMLVKFSIKPHFKEWTFKHYTKITLLTIIEITKILWFSILIEATPPMSV